MQLACQAAGGKVRNVPAREYGRARCRVTRPGGLFAGVPDEIDVWMSHGDQVSELSGEFLPLAATATCPFAAVKHRTLPIYGLQFHPEVTHTPEGAKIIGNFLQTVCGCGGTWRLGDFARETVEAVRLRVGDGRVICGLSGGVDSSVVAALLAEAIGPQVSCILVDNGLLRKAKEESVIREFTGHFKTDLHVVKAEENSSKAWPGRSTRKRRGGRSAGPSSNALPRRR